jgi:hypothetical protein
MALPFRRIMNALTALNAVSDTLTPTDLNNIKELTFYIVFSAGCSAGGVQCEEVPYVSNPDWGTFTGTWAPIGSAVVFGDNVVKTVKASGIDMFARVRISTLVVDGTVSVFVIGR